jgi:hypothetical protein
MTVIQTGGNMASMLSGEMSIKELQKASMASREALLHMSAMTLRMKETTRFKLGDCSRRAD